MVLPSPATTATSPAIQIHWFGSVGADPFELPTVKPAEAVTTVPDASVRLAETSYDPLAPGAQSSLTTFVTVHPSGTAAQANAYRPVPPEGWAVSTADSPSWIGPGGPVTASRSGPPPS